jgi:hypothetical protein
MMRAIMTIPFFVEGKLGRVRFGHVSSYRKMVSSSPGVGIRTRRVTWGPVDAGKSMPSPSPGGGFLLLAKRERTMNRRVAAVLRGTVGKGL